MNDWNMVSSYSRRQTGADNIVLALQSNKKIIILLNNTTENNIVSL